MTPASCSSSSTGWEAARRPELAELEVEAGGTGRRSCASRRCGAAEPAQRPSPSPAPAAASPVEARRPVVAGRDAGPTLIVVAPLTGLFYISPSPGAAPYVQVGGEVAVGQVIGLIEAMKLFNEIKSDVAGRVVRIHAETGALVKAKQPLIEVEP